MSNNHCDSKRQHRLKEYPYESILYLEIIFVKNFKNLSGSWIFFPELGCGPYFLSPPPWRKARGGGMTPPSGRSPGGGYPPPYEKKISRAKRAKNFFGPFFRKKKIFAIKKTQNFDPPFLKKISGGGYPPPGENFRGLTPPLGEAQGGGFGPPL